MITVHRNAAIINPVLAKNIARMTIISAYIREVIVLAKMKDLALA